MRDDLVSISLAADHHYLPGLLATMSSMILFASRKDLLLFHVFADGLSQEDCEQVETVAKRMGLSSGQIEFHHPDMSRIRELFTPYNGSYAAFLRLFLCEFLSEDWTLYTDVDTLWFCDAYSLWQERNNEVSVLWCKDLPSIARGVKEYSRAYCPDLDVNRYACSGVMLMNLARMRTNDFVSQCARFAERWGTPLFVDQDILNVICLQDAKLLDQVWDCMAPTRAAIDGCVLHFNGIGRMFNGPMKGWRVLYYAWYRYYYDIVEGNPCRSVCPWFKRVFFWMAGSFYPSKPLMRILFSGLGDQAPDNFERYFFFAWLFRRAKWWRKWSVST